MGRKKPPPASASPAAPFNPAFSGLEALKAELGPSGGAAPEDGEPERGAPERAEGRAGEDRPTEPPGASSTSDPANAPLVRTRAKIVVRRERKGHGGKTVTRITGLEGTADELNALARSLAKSLGVGAKLEDAEIWVQGDQIDRLQEALRQRGAKRVIVGTY